MARRGQEERMLGGGGRKCYLSSDTSAVMRWGRTGTWTTRTGRGRTFPRRRNMRRQASTGPLRLFAIVLGALLWKMDCSACNTLCLCMRKDLLGSRDRGGNQRAALAALAATAAVRLVAALGARISRGSASMLSMTPATSAVSCCSCRTSPFSESQPYPVECGRVLRPASVRMLAREARLRAATLRRWRHVRG